MSKSAAMRLKESSILAKQVILVALCGTILICSTTELKAQVRKAGGANSEGSNGTPAVRTAEGSSASSDSVQPASAEVKVSKIPIVPGLTEVPLEKGLERLISGRDPQNVEELLALERQQSKIAKKIKLVTVNVQQGASQGSGVVVTPDGYVLTAAHVAGRPNLDAYVVFSDGKRARAKTLGMNRDVDAGLLKIVDERDEPWPYATLGSSGELSEGQWCIAAGHPGGWQSQRGAVIRVGRVLTNLDQTIFTDCALIGGDSGGPLFDLKGKLIGIHSRIGARVDENMHVPVDEFTKKAWDRMVRGEKWGVLPGYEPIIGIQGDEQDSRAVVKSLTPGGPADKAGVQLGDLVVQFDGVAVNSFAELKEAVRNCMPGDRVFLELKRDEQSISVPVVIGLRE